MQSEDNFYLLKNPEIVGNPRLSLKARRRLAKPKADNTLKAYNSDWNDFVAWCRRHDEPELPTTPETIVNYLSDMADMVKANTLSRRIAAISANHIAAGFGRKNPAKENIIRLTLDAIRRENGTFQKGKAPILPETLLLFADLFGTDLPSVRDKALILLGFAGAFRRSELVAVRLDDLQFFAEGMTVFVPRSKGDQIGEGSTIAIPYAPQENICAVRAVKDWIEQSGITDGYLFRSFRKNHAVRDGHLSDQMVAQLVKKYAKLAGLSAINFAGHSLRRGFATSAAQHEVGVLSIMRQTRHKTESMVHRYVDQGNIFKNNPLDRIWQ